MIKVRNGVFETNSSSVHSIVISDKDPEKLPKKIVFRRAEFNMDREDITTVYERASYLYELILSCDDDYMQDQRLEELKEFLESKGIQVIYPSRHYDEWGQIGHGCEISEIVAELFRNKELILRLILSPESKIQTGYDGDDRFLNNEMIKEEDDHPGFVVFNKWN